MLFEGVRTPIFCELVRMQMYDRSDPFLLIFHANQAGALHADS